MLLAIGWTASNGFFSCRPHGLELSAGLYPGPGDQYSVFQMCTQNVFVRSILVHPAHEGFFTII